MDELEEEQKSSGSVNFIPCLRFVRRGVAKANPERVKLDGEELAAVIQQTRKKINDRDNDGDEDEEENDDKGKHEHGVQSVAGFPFLCVNFRTCEQR